MTQILNFLPNLVTLPALKSHIRFDIYYFCVMRIERQEKLARNAY